MAKIREYRNEVSQVELHPSNEGYSAEELTARRVGAFSTQTAAGQREAAHLVQQGDTAAGDLVNSFLRFSGLNAKTAGETVKTARSGGPSTGFGGEGTVRGNPAYVDPTTGQV